MDRQHEQAREKLSKAYVYDFDGTLTKDDSLIAFIRHSKGLVRLLAALMWLLPRLVLMKLHLCDNGRTKERLFSLLYRGMTLQDFDARCRAFARERGDLFYPNGLADLWAHAGDGHPVFVVSASIDNWVRPLIGCDSVQVVGTRIEVVDGRLTGRFLTPNCYGAEKVRRLEEVFPERNQYWLVAHGDSRGDREMLAYADEARFRPFKPDAKSKWGEVVRFAIVGTLATLLQYAVYGVLLTWMTPTVAMTIGYAVSFVFNFIASTYFTFHVKASARRGAGFALSHAVNYVLQMLTLNLFLWMGLGKAWAPIPMFCVCVPVNFLLVRYFLKR